jgi:hypothetical protein
VEKGLPQPAPMRGRKEAAMSPAQPHDAQMNA